MIFIATHEDTDVALLRTHRYWMFVWWQAITPAFAVAGAVLVARRLRGDASHTVAAAFALTAAWTTLVASWTLFENAFLFEALAILPLFAVVLAAPVGSSERSRERMALVGAAVVCLFVGVRVAKLVRAGVTWSGRDPGGITEFVRAHVPPGSEVIGLDEDYFFAVEESRSRYLTASQISASDWARWVPQIDGVRPAAAPPLTGDYLLWPAQAIALPTEAASMSCMVATPIATFQPPPPDLPALSWVVRDDPRAAYAATTLYALSRRAAGAGSPSDWDSACK
jgi:hypothetical protein